MDIEIKIPQWDKVSEWDRARKPGEGDGHGVRRFILDNEPAGEADSTLWRLQLAAMLQRVAEDAIDLYIMKLNNYFEIQWPDNHYALQRALGEIREEEFGIDYSQE